MLDNDHPFDFMGSFGKKRVTHRSIQYTPRFKVEFEVKICRYREIEILVERCTASIKKNTFWSLPHGTDVYRILKVASENYEFNPDMNIWQGYVPRNDISFVLSSTAQRFTNTKHCDVHFADNLYFYLAQGQLC